MKSMDSWERDFSSLDNYPVSKVLKRGCSEQGKVQFVQWKLFSFYSVVLPYNIGCWTGQPRVGNRAFAEGMDKILQSTGYYRMINNRDIVPHIPFRLMHYVHSGIEVWYPKEKYNDGVMCSRLVCTGQPH